MYDLVWSHNKNYLMVDNVILKSQTAHPPKSADGKAHFTNWSYGFSHGSKQFVLINCSREILGICFKRTYMLEYKLRDCNFLNGGEKINTLP